MKIIHKPLNCKCAMEMMSAYMDGELSAGDRLRFENHIAECDSCKEELTIQKEIQALIKASAKMPPRSLHAGVMEKIKDMPQDKKASRSPLMRFIHVGTVAAAAAVMLLVVSRGLLPGGVPADMAIENQVDARAGTSDNGAKDITGFSYGINAENDVSSESGNSEETRVFTTTASLTVLSPAITEAGAHDEVPESGVGKIFNSLEAEDVAVIVCYESDLPDALTMPTSTLVTDGVECEVFEIFGNDMRIFVELLTDLNDGDTEFYAAIPNEEFGTCRIYAVNDANK